MYDKDFQRTLFIVFQLLRMAFGKLFVSSRRTVAILLMHHLSASFPLHIYAGVAAPTCSGLRVCDHG